MLSFAPSKEELNQYHRESDKSNRIAEEECKNGDGTIFYYVNGSAMNPWFNRVVMHCAKNQTSEEQLKETNK